MSSVTYRFTLENGSGFILLQSGAGYLVQEAQPAAAVVVKAVEPGIYNGVFRNIGDVFQLITPEDFVDSTVSLVPVGNPNYPLYGWMLVMPTGTPLTDYSLTTQGASSSVTATVGTNAGGQKVYGQGPGIGGRYVS